MKSNEYRVSLSDLGLRFALSKFIAKVAWRASPTSQTSLEYYVLECFAPIEHHIQAA